MSNSSHVSDSSFMGIILIIGFAVGLGVGIYLFRRFFKAEYKGIEKVQVDVLKAIDVVNWFKKDEILKQIRENPDIICVAIKGDSVKTIGNITDVSDNKNQCVVALFNKKKNSIITGQIFIYKEMEEDLKKMFGDKDMIVID